MPVYLYYSQVHDGHPETPAPIRPHWCATPQIADAVTAYVEEAYGGERPKKRLPKQTVVLDPGGSVWGTKLPLVSVRTPTCRYQLHPSHVRRVAWLLEGGNRKVYPGGVEVRRLRCFYGLAILPPEDIDPILAWCVEHGPECDLLVDDFLSRVRGHPHLLVPASPVKWSA